MDKLDNRNIPGNILTFKVQMHERFSSINLAFARLYSVRVGSHELSPPAMGASFAVAFALGFSLAAAFALAFGNALASRASAANNRCECGLMGRCFEFKILLAMSTGSK